MIKRGEELKGELLTKQERNKIINNSDTVTVPKDVHEAGPTYKGKNTEALKKSDAKDLASAAKRDSDAMVKNSERLGHSGGTTQKLKDVCSAITCKSNKDYDGFLNDQLD